MSNGKGDNPRPVDGERFRSNWDDIFKRKTCDMCRHFRYDMSHVPGIAPEEWCALERDEWTDDGTGCRCYCA